MNKRVMGKGHELNPLAAAICASMALALFFASGFSCSFLDINATDNDLLVILESSKQAAQRSSSIGVLCEGDFYSLEDDAMWSLSRIFFFVSVSLGVVAFLMAWAIATFARPTRFAWQVLSVLAGAISVIQVPVFILFEVEPCTDYKADQECTLSSGAYLCMASVASWFLVTLVTQLLDPPAWVNNLEYWRARMSGSSMCSLRTREMFGASASSIEEEEPTSDKVSLLRPMQRWMQRRQWAATEETFNMDEEEGGGAVSSAPAFEPKGPEQDPSSSQEALVSFNKTFAKSPPSFSTGTDTGTDTVVQEEVNESFETDQPVESGWVFARRVKEKQVEPLPSAAAPDSSQSVSTAMRLDSITLQAAPIVVKLPPESPESPDFLIRDEPMSLQSPDGSETPLDVMQTTLPVMEAEKRSTPVIIPIITEPFFPFAGTNPSATTAKTPSLTPAESRKVPLFEDDSLGSLVSKVTGTESVLDNPVIDITFDSSASPEQKMGREPPRAASNMLADQKKESPLQEKALLAATLVEKLNIARARAKARRGYRFMDDSQIDFSNPTSPPFEIMVNMDDKDSSFLHGANATSEEESNLINDWDKLHHAGSLLDRDDKFTGSAGKLSHVSSNNSLPQLGYDGEPEPFLHFSDDSDDEDEDEDDEYRKETSRSFGDSELSGESGSSQGSPEAKGSKTLRVKRRRKKKNLKDRSTGSIASSPSLLDTVIAEETVEDLEGESSNHVDDSNAFDPYTSRLSLKRSLSAPNLAAFAAGTTDDSRFADGLILGGMNSYQQVETWRDNISFDNSRKTTVSHLHKSHQEFEPSYARKPIFKEERDIRAGIHAPASTSSDSSSNDERSTRTSPSRRSREARIARLRRERAAQSKLAPRARSLDPPTERLSSSLSLQPTALPPRPPSLEAHKERQASPSSPLLSVVPPRPPSVDTSEKQPSLSSRPPSVHSRSSSAGSSGETKSHPLSPSPPSVRSRSSSIDSSKDIQPQSSSQRPPTTVCSRSFSEEEIPQESQPQRPLGSRSFLTDDANEIMLDALDLSLAEVQRPHGAEYGPDEVSL